MPRSLQCLIFHTILFVSFISASLLSSYLVLTRHLHGGEVLLGFGILALLIAAFWLPFKGGCPFTVWEREALQRERKPAYEGSCILHYAKQWFGIQLPHNADNAILAIAFLIP